MSKSANNVVMFPKSKTVSKEIADQKMEDIQHNVEMMKHYHIQEAITTLAPIIFNQLDIAGFGISEDDDISDIKDGAFVVESIRSLMCKYYGLYHPFQVIAENVFDIDEDDSEGSFKIAETLNLELKKPETE